MNIYFANDLFNDGTRMYNEHVVRTIEDELSDKVSVYLPQRNLGINDKNAYADSRMIAEADYTELKKSDLLIAVLDNNDFGVGVEIGIAYEAGIPIIGLFTDVRQQGGNNPDKIKALTEIGENQIAYVNLMGVGIIKNNGVIVNNLSSLIKEIERVGDI